MNSETRSEQPVSAAGAPLDSVPWEFRDHWIGIGLLVLIDVLVFLITYRYSTAAIARTGLFALLELAYILPVVVIFAWRHISWKAIGFGRLDWTTLALGCGFIVAAYGIILLYGSLLLFFGIKTQGQQVTELFARLDSPLWVFLAGAIVAPFVEEIFFRGFLFQGFRQRYGWVKAMLLSSAIFGAAHLDLVAMIPAFILGNVLAYTYQRSNSVWPGIIIHFINNAFTLVVAYLIAHYRSFIPS
jgi:membrane protease YdiL (CAAX protease family)